VTDPEPDGARTRRGIDPSAEQRRRDRVFGEVLPEATADDRELDGSEGVGGADKATEAWLRDNVPPHHG
jgi:hypothetical protein